MRLPLFSRSSPSLERAQAQDRVEKLLISSLRLLGQACGKVADLLEAQRQERNLGASSHTFLRRLDVQEEPKPSRER